MLPDSKFYHLQVVKVGRRMHVFHCEATAKEREEGAEMQPSAPCEFWRARGIVV
jgi:hypothetical protein